MVYSIQNSETGEVHYIHKDMNSIKVQVVDRETGEPLNGTRVKVRYVKHDNFYIPKKYLRSTSIEDMTSSYEDSNQQTDTNMKVSTHESQANEKDWRTKYKKEDFMNMDGVKNDVILGYQKANYQMYLIPTLFCYKMGFAVFLLVIEAILHFWAHRTNTVNMNKSYYFRSPLHLLTSQFCGFCRGEKEMDIKIFQTQNEQMRKAKR